MDKMPYFNNFVFQNIYIFMYDLSWTDCLVAKTRLRTDPCISHCKTLWSRHADAAVHSIKECICHTGDVVA